MPGAHFLKEFLQQLRVPVYITSKRYIPNVLGPTVPTVLAKTVGPKTLQISHTLQNIFAPVSYTHNHEVCSSFTQMRRCFVFYVKLSSFFGIYTGTLSCVVKLPDEVRASHTKRVGDKRIYNSRSSQKCCSLVYPFKNIFIVF